MSGCHPYNYNCNCNEALSNSIADLRNRIEALHEHKIRQIDENRKISKRVDELESAYKADYETAREIIFQGAQTHSSIIRCEAKFKELEEMVRKILKGEMQNENRPFKCPVCEGSGKKTNVLLSMPPQYPDCKSCEGKGIVWG